MIKSSHYNLIFWVINLSLATIKLLFALRPELNLFTEEAQYWLWSRNLDWHYYSKPPMIAGLNFISTAFFGNTEVAIRIIPILLGIATSGVIYQFAKLIYKSERVALWASLIFLAMPISFLEFTFHTTDTSMTFFWTLAWYLLYRGIKSSEKRWWLFAGIATALGIMSKSTMLLIFPASIIFLVLTGSWQKNRIHFVLFTLVATLGFLPGLIWNFQNDFYTFRHIAALGGASGGVPKPFDFGLLLKRTSEYLGGQLAMVSVFFLPFFFLAIKQLVKSFNSTSFYLILPGALTFLGFGGLSLFTWVEVNWPGFAYSTFAIFIAAGIDQMGKSLRMYKKWAVGISFFLPVLLLLPNFSGWKSSGPIFKTEKATFKRMIGYDELANRIDFLKDSLGISQPVIFSESYHVASEMSFYLEGNPQTFVANMGSRKNQWDLWPGLDQFVGDPKYFVFVSRNQDSPLSVMDFEKLVFEVELPYFYGSDSLGKTNIQIWENLQNYRPINTGSF
jgi:hypothetical protein